MLWNSTRRPVRSGTTSRRVSASPGRSSSTDRRPRRRSPSGSTSPRPPYDATSTSSLDEGARRGARAAQPGRPRTRPPGQGLRADRVGPRRLRPAVRRPRRPGAAVPGRDRRRRRRPGIRDPPGGVHPGEVREHPGRAPRAGLRGDPGSGVHRRGVRRDGSRQPGRASSCASSTARSPTWPTSSRSCARPRPRRSAWSSAATSSDWPRSPTATGSAPPASRAHPDHHEANTKERVS